VKITVTGGSGYIGRYVCENIPNASITSLGRSAVPSSKIHNILLEKPHLISSDKFPDGNTFLHLAGYSDNRKKANKFDYSSVNVDWPRIMLEKAIEKNYRNFIFMSTAKVYGDFNDYALTANTALNPCDRYAESKLLAEEKLNEYRNNIAITILRPPAVYGEPAKGGFKKIIDACHNNRFLPIGSNSNKRSFIGLDNLASVITACLVEQENGCKSYLVHDGEVLSTRAFIESVAGAVNSRPRLVRSPESLLVGVDAISKFIFNKQPLSPIHRNFFIECNEFEKRYNWRSLHSTTEGLESVLRSYPAESD